MGNSLGGIRKKPSAKIMKINGESLKVRVPVRAGSVLESHPGQVLLESESVKHYGVRAKPLEPQMELKSNRLYFLVKLPNVPEAAPNKAARRVSSGIQMSAKDRLESLMLARRSASDLTIVNQATVGGGEGVLRVRVRLPKAEVEKLMAESKSGVEMTEKIAQLYRSGVAAVQDNAAATAGKGAEGFAEHAPKLREKRVKFLPISEDGIPRAVPSSTIPL